MAQKATWNSWHCLECDDMRFVRVGSCDLVDRAYSSGQRSDPRNHIYEEVVGVKRKVKTHFTADARRPFLS